MAQGIQLERDRFCCSLCLDLLNNPVSVPCGHSFCLTCINKRLDSEENSGIYSCPQCREIFMSRPTLVKNSMIELVVQELRKKDPPDVQPGPPDNDGDVEPGAVVCDFCSDRKVKAIKSCLQCMASYCATHLQPHNEVPPLRKHKLVEPTADLEESICPQHQEVMKMFCRTDQRCICYLCSKDDHKGHIKVSTAAERADRQKDLQTVRQKVQQMIREKRKDVEAFQQEEDSLSNAAGIALSSTDQVFTDFIRTTEKKLAHMKQKMLSRQNSEVGRFRNVRNKLEDEVKELNRKDVELDKLYHTEDHTHFLLKYPSLSRLSEPKGQPSIRLRRQRNFERVTATVSEAKKRLHKVLDEECEKIILAITGASFPTTPQTEPEETRFKSSQIKPEHGQTTAEFVQGRILQTLVSPNLNRADFSKPRFRDSRHSRQVSLDLYREEPTVRFAQNGDLGKETEEFLPINRKENPDLIKTNKLPERSPDVLLGRIKTPRKVLQTRAQFLQYACQITLNPDTANPNLMLDKENRKVTCIGEEQNYPNHPERFAYTWQVLSQQPLTNRCYLEVERNTRGVMVAICYKGISRAGTFSQCMFGENSQSWAIDCFKNSCEFRHNRIRMSIPGTWSSKLGVYVDQSAGVLSFYSVSKTMTLLHKVQTTFTEPLYVGLWLSDGATAEFCKLE
ncbi:PREDICTED: tripartite motif-containing protein 16-like [Cyprinodon variegatus]|uniref:Tripartite motif-containing protein 16-like n=1 Tax=Cyprinodon variegatus TaxID=28743 RepID=A0A3Q2C822_CYPVA|nr:PREDICTED: tripartite motif-containing protein 16-like [Cyprinodon variegatus]